ncbi:hypothetical protein [Methanopyrus kandleri]|uniref:hypothetical protein n=1 Tax=Methanopyrus kandleri TaxID=2320 RepID=UPI0011E4F510|nr:hypothetical protein [Methanopyrus kandleri]
MTAVYVLYAATCWWDKDGNPVDAVPMTVCYDDGSAYSTSVGIIDWCATDPRAYDDEKRRVAAACAVLPQLEAHWVRGEPLVYQTPTLVFPKRVFADGREEPNTKRPILWLLKLVFPPDKRPTWIEFGYHPGHLWVLAITVRTTDGKYYALDKDGRRDLGEPEQKVVLEPNGGELLTADTSGSLFGTSVKVTAEWCWPKNAQVEALNLKFEWPLTTTALGSALSVTVRVPSGHLLRDAIPTPDDWYLKWLRDQLRDEIIRSADNELRSLSLSEEEKEIARRCIEYSANLTANTARGDAFAALTLVALYDRLASRIAEKLGVHVYRAVPAYVTVLTAWRADLWAILEHVNERISKHSKVLTSLALPKGYDTLRHIAFTQFLIYQPTLGLEVYGPSLEARAVNAVLSLLLPGLEQTILEIGRGASVAEGDRVDVDWQEVRDKLGNNLREIGIKDPEGTAQEIVEALKYLTELVKYEDMDERLKSAGVQRYVDPFLERVPVIFNRTPSLEAAVLSYTDVATWTTTIYTLFPVPSKGASTPSGCFCGPMTDNLKRFWNSLADSILYFLAYHALGNAAISLAISLLIGGAIGEIAAGVLTPVIVAAIKAGYFNDWSDWNKLKMFANETASTAPASFTAKLQWAIHCYGGGRAKAIATTVSFAFAYLSSVCTGAKLP